MRKLISVSVAILLCLCCAFNTVYAKNGDVTGKALNTDIVAYINNYAIPSFAVNGQSVIVAEDLRNFGFDVVWDEGSRSLIISRNSATEVYEMTVNKFEKTGTVFANVLQTNIKVFANGRQLTSYAINGYTMVPFEELDAFGEINWVSQQRAIKLWVDNLNIRNSMQPVEKCKIGLPSGSEWLVKDGMGFGVDFLDGIEMYWEGKNNTGKTINYYTLYYSMYNAVGDPAYDEISGSYKVTSKYVGPVYPGDYLIEFDTIAYSSLCSKVVLDKIFIEYNDGTTEWVYYGYAGYETLVDYDSYSF